MGIWIRVYGVIEKGLDGNSSVLQLNLEANVMIAIYRDMAAALEAQQRLGGAVLETTIESIQRLFSRIHDDGLFVTDSDTSYIGAGKSTEKPAIYVVAAYSKEDDEWLDALYKTTGIGYSV